MHEYVELTISIKGTGVPLHAEVRKTAMWNTFGTMVSRKPLADPWFSPAPGSGLPEFLTGLCFMTLRGGQEAIE